VIERSEIVRSLVKSDVGQRIVQAVRAAPHVRPSGRFLVRSVIAPNRTSVYSVRGSTAHVVLRHRTDDVLGFNEIFHRWAYAMPPEVEERLRRAGRPLRIIDLGANIGLFSSWILSSLPVVEIDAYEPDPANAAVLRAVRDANAATDRLHIHEACAGVEAAVVPFAAGDFIHSRVVAGGVAGTIDVQQEDVMPLLLRADLVKIDIEGSEWAIFEDERWLEIPALAVVMEWHVTDAVTDGDSQATLALERGGLTVVHRYSEEPSCGVMWAVRR
jgi:FkbM family methyltransferase